MAFITTQVIELPIYGLLARKIASIGTVLFAGALGTLVTHPLLWFLWHPKMGHSVFTTILGETLVAITEGLVLKLVVPTMTFSKALSLSLLANATSYGIGLLLYQTGIL